jgi:hypothetical protein
MLPGFRFLFAAIVLSMSIMVFGLGAAALLRAAHEEFASNPSWHATPEASFAQSEVTRPMLAMLQIEPPPAEPKVSGDVPAAAVIAAPVAPVEPVAMTSPPAEPEKTAALTSEDPAPTETAKSETIAKPEVQASEIKDTEIKDTEIKDSEIKAVDASTPTEAAPAPPDTAAPVAEGKVATTEQFSPPANDGAPPTFGPTGSTKLPNPAIPSTKIATLGGPAVTIEAAPPAKAAASTRKRVQARRVIRRHRIARTTDGPNRSTSDRPVCADDCHQTPPLKSGRSGRPGRDRRSVGHAPFGP